VTDKALVLSKLSTLRDHVARVRRRPDSAEAIRGNVDLQDASILEAARRRRTHATRRTGTMSANRQVPASQTNERVLWPRGRKTAEVVSLAPRLHTLEGKTIGQLWDDLFRGDEIFPMLEEALSARFPGVTFVGYKVFGSTHGRDEQRVITELPARLRQLGVDAIISGMAC
jgi:hypothetical protein